MALPTSGQISLGDINVELGLPRTNSLNLITARNGGIVPINQGSTNKPKTTGDARVSDWYGYNHTQSLEIQSTITFNPSSNIGTMKVFKNSVEVWSSAGQSSINTIKFKIGDSLLIYVTSDRRLHKYIEIDGGLDYYAYRAPNQATGTTLQSHTLYVSNNVALNIVCKISSREL